MERKRFYRSALILLILSTVIMIMTWMSALSKTNKFIIIIIVGIILTWYIQYFSTRLTDKKNNRRNK